MSLFRAVGVLLLAPLLVLALSPLQSATAKPASLPKIPANGHFDYQLGGPRVVPESVKTVVRDRNARPLKGKFNVCYVNAFQTQPDEKAFWKKRSSLLLRKNGKLVNDGQWHETLLDLRTAGKRKRLAAITDRWLAGCKRAGFQAVEFDNLDSYTRSKGLLKRKHAVAYGRLLTARAHKHGLAAGQKNMAEWNGRKAGFDFAVAEECGEWKECSSYVSYYGSQVLMVEYTAKGFSYACTNFGSRTPVTRRDMDLSPKYKPTYC